MLLTCQAGFETLLERELAAGGVVAVEKGPGWVRTTGTAFAETRAFPHLELMAPVELRSDSVNALAQRVAEFFLASLQGERVDAAWPCIWLGPQEITGLGRRIAGVEEAFRDLLKKKLSRVAKLATANSPRGAGRARGLWVYFTDFGRMFVARDAYLHGQRRMADDDLAPSRSYLKIEEAYVVLGREPVAGETVCDLGAAPGGWSYSAAKRGARVLAIDNGPLKSGALNHPHIEHWREDAFKYRPSFVTRGGTSEGKTSPGGLDWLFCDLVEEPHHVMQHLVAPWLAQGWCRRFVINLKFGRVDPIALLGELNGPDSPFVQYAPGYRIRHLYHDREEFTVVGEVRGVEPQMNAN